VKGIESEQFANALHKSKLRRPCTGNRGALGANRDRSAPARGARRFAALPVWDPDRPRGPRTLCSTKYAALVIVGLGATAQAFSPAGIALRAPCVTPQTCVRASGLPGSAPDGSYRDDAGNLRDQNGNLLQAGTGRGSDADVAAQWFAQKQKAEEEAAAEALKPKVTIDMSGDQELMAWKDQKERERAEQQAAVEAKMAQWLAAAEAKKAQTGSN
jgi:hypothetical protein